MRLTPTQLQALLFLAHKRDQRERIMDFAIARTAEHGDKDAVKKLMRRLDP